MSILSVVVVFSVFLVTWCQNINEFAGLQCEPFDDDQEACESYSFEIPGYGTSNCVYVPLTSIAQDINDPEYVCLPDHCGLFVNNQTRCELDEYCSWENDANTQRSDEFRCFPACFNKVDMMFLVDGSISQNETIGNTGLTNFELTLLAIREFVSDRIPDKGLFNDIFEVREYFISFGGQSNGGGFSFPSTLDFEGAELINQTAAANLLLNLVAPGGGTNLRRALTEANLLFEAQTAEDAQRVLLTFSDAVATDFEYLEFSFPSLGITDFSDANTRISLGQINCDNFGVFPFIACQPVQFFDLGPVVWDPLDVYYQFFLLGDEEQVFPPGIISDGPTFAENFVVNATTDLVEVMDIANLDIFFDGDVSATRLARPIDASICSRPTNNGKGPDGKGNEGKGNGKGKGKGLN